MAVITLTITESSQQIVAGIPKTLTLEANIPCNIFYTVDGTTPTILSPLYISAITLPTNASSVVFSAYATNGIDESEIISETYAPDFSDARYSHDTIVGMSGTSMVNKYPFGNASVSTNMQFGSTGGIIIDAADVDGIPDGYDSTGTGSRSNETDLNLESYDFVYSETNSRGERGHGIGTLQTKMVRRPAPAAPSTSSDANDKYFNPRAMIIHQDSRDTPYDPNMSHLNREFFSLANPERSREGHQFSNRGFEANSVSGSLLRSQFNAYNNTITYYYRDNDTGRWIISVEPAGTNSSVGQLSKVVFSSRQSGSNFVFKWIPFKSRRLI